MPISKEELSTLSSTRYDFLPGPLKITLLFLFAIGIVGFLFFTYSWSVGEWVLDGTVFFYVLYATFSASSFLMFPARKKDRERVRWYDLVLAVLVSGSCIYFISNSWEINMIGWLPAPTLLPIILAVVMCLAGLESGRRIAGLPFAILCLVIGVYPIFAERMPGVLWGYSFNFSEVVSAFAFGKLGMLGLPAQVTGDYLIGFLIFAGILMATGAGDFFLKFALALLGRFRGGPAKVAVLASGFFGSLSGTPIANIIATGSVTIPTMKRIGYPAHYAAAIEAVASTGGVIMPPVMGTIAFIMAIITDIPYTEIIIAAFIPALLYYWGLLVQVDAFSARVGLVGLPKKDIPSLRATLKEGWQFLLVLAFLVFGLIYMRWGVVAALYASGLLLALSFFRRDTMMTPRRFLNVLATIGGLITYVMAIMLPIGLVMMGIQLSGSLAAVTAAIVSIAGGNTIVLLLLAVAICYIFGMIGIALIPYVVLAVVVMPGIVESSGMNMMALHLFLIYYLLTSGITPPVCISAFVAAAVADAPPMKTGFTAMRLAVVLYFIPFFFVYNPSLILQGSLIETLYLFPLCIIGIWILASGLEGYLIRVGRLPLWSRPVLTLAGFGIAFPEWWSTGAGAVITGIVVFVLLSLKKRSPDSEISGGEVSTA